MVYLKNIFKNFIQLNLWILFFILNKIDLLHYKIKEIEQFKKKLKENLQIGFSEEANNYFDSISAKELTEENEKNKDFMYYLKFIIKKNHENEKNISNFVKNKLKEITK